MAKPPFPGNSNTQHPELRISFLIALASLLAIHLYHAFTRRADPDEFQTILNALDFWRGQRLYVDYWDNHGPLITWLAAPLLELSGNLQHRILYVARATILLNTALVLVLTWLLTRLAFPLVRFAPPLAVLLLASSPTNLLKSIEFRPDNPATLLFLSGLLLLLSALKKPKAAQFVFAGFVFALISGFTLKALILGFSAALVAAVVLVLTRQRPTARQIIQLIIGGAIAIAVIAIPLWTTGSWIGFVPCYLGGNVSRDHDFSIQAFLDIYVENTAWAILLTVGSLLPFFHRPTRLRFPLAAGLAAASLFLYLQFALLLPTKHLQSLLPAHPLAAVGAAGVMAQAIANFPKFSSRRRRILTISLALLAILTIFDLYRIHRKNAFDLPSQIMFADSIVARMEPWQPIFDPSGIVFLQPRSAPFHVLVTFLRDLYNEGRIDLDVSEQLQRAHAVIGSRRTYDLPLQDLKQIERDFQRVHSIRQYDLYLRAPGPTTKTLPPAPKFLEAIAEAKPRHHITDRVEKNGKVHWFADFMTIHNTHSRRAP